MKKSLYNETIMRFLLRQDKKIIKHEKKGPQGLDYRTDDSANHANWHYSSNLFYC